ncbi:MAG: sodium:solute symporter [Candidatus Didemnitutus sp.]|nr:sodium:solute symporter [Candidatus Didemnitutus sp.]
MKSLMPGLTMCLLLLGACLPLCAENLVPVRTAAMGELTGPVSEWHLTVLAGRPVALCPVSAAAFDESRKEWTPLERGNPSEPVLAVVQDGIGAILILGRMGDQATLRVERLTLDGNRLVTRALAPLPMELSSVQGAVRAGRLFVAGLGADGAGKLFSLNLAAPATGWTPHADWPGDTHGATSLVAQDQALFLTVRGAEDDGDSLLRWTLETGWTAKPSLSGRVVGGTARPIGQGHILYLLHGPPAGTGMRLVSFHTITGSSAVLKELGAQVAGAGTGWKNGVLWTETKAGASVVVFAELVPSQRLIGSVDWMVITIYLAGMIGIGLYFYLREKKQSTAEFFVGGRSIPFWAAGISLYATNTSSISYIAIPAKAFATNWQYLMNNLVAVLGLLFVAVWIVPLLRRLDLMSVFHYLETRFHPAIRTITSALCIAMQLGGRMSVVLFLPSLAISTITGIDVVWSILIMGTVTICYTAMGGMKAVIWTDCLQLVVMFGGALFAIGFIVLKLDGGFGEFFATAALENKTQLFDWSFDLTKATVWGFIFLVLFDVVLTFPKDQVLMQRVLSTKSSREASRSIWTFAAIMVPGGFLFYLIGTALYVFYKAHPERMNPLLTTDATFPLFIAAELPMGVTGLIIAGIIAASMSTLSSILNSVATLGSVDFYEKLVKKRDPAVSVRVAEWMTVGAGIIGMGLALLLSRYDINSLFDVSIELSGMLSGGFAGAYTLGMFTRRANWQGVVIGIATSIMLTILAWSQSLVHPYFYMPISILICIVVGYLTSFLFPPPTQSLDGLTIFTRQDETVSPSA